MDNYRFMPAAPGGGSGAYRSSFASGLDGMTGALSGLMSQSFGGFGGMSARRYSPGNSFGVPDVGSLRQGFRPVGGGYQTVNAYNAGYVPPTPPTTGTGYTGSVGTLNPTAGNNQYDAFFVQAAQEMSQRYGVQLDPALLKAMAHIESGGTYNNNLTRDDGFGDGLSVGIMQVKPNLWQDLVPDADPFDPLGNIRLGAALIAQSMAQGMTWDQAITQVYFPVNDPNGTTQEDYLNWTREYMAKYGGPGGMVGTPQGGWNGNVSTHGTSTYAPPAGSALWSITGGTPYGISQGFGMTDFAMYSEYANAGAYDYATQYGGNGHIGLDISTPFRTPIYAPVGGTIVTSGGTGYYRDVMGGGIGELKLVTDNGDEIIFGHMNSGIPVGTRVTPGMQIGLSGGENGYHFHLEVRKAGASTPSGFQAVDPRDYFGGTYTGGMQTGGGYSGTSGFTSYSGTQDLNRMLGRRMPGMPAGYGGSYGGQSVGGNYRYRSY